MGGGRVSTTTEVCQTDGRIIDPKIAFDSFRLELSEYCAMFYINVTDDVTGQIKGHFFKYLALLASPGKAVVSLSNKADGTIRIVSGIKG